MGEGSQFACAPIWLWLQRRPFEHKYFSRARCAAASCPETTCLCYCAELLFLLQNVILMRKA